MTWKRSPVLTANRRQRIEWVLPSFNPITRLAVAQETPVTLASQYQGFISTSRTVINTGDTYLLFKPIGSAWRARTEYVITDGDFVGTLVFDRTANDGDVYRFRFLYFQP